MRVPPPEDELGEGAAEIFLVATTRGAGAGAATFLVPPMRTVPVLAVFLAAAAGLTLVVAAAACVLFYVWKEERERGGERGRGG